MLRPHSTRWIVGQTDVVQFIGLWREFQDGDELMTSAEASAAARCLGTWQGHLASLLGTARGLSGLQHAFLENRLSKGLRISADAEISIGP